MSRPFTEFACSTRVAGLHAALRRLNALRAGSGEADRAQLAVVEDIFDHVFAAGRHLAVYGSLAPGKENHRLVEGLGGEWSNGAVRGDLRDVGWGADVGYPGLTWRPEGPPIPVKLLVSDDLPGHWETLDEFEGPAYCRILVPVESDAGPTVIANIYEVRTGGVS